MHLGSVLEGALPNAVLYFLREECGVSAVRCSLLLLVGTSPRLRRCQN